MPSEAAELDAAVQILTRVASTAQRVADDLAAYEARLTPVLQGIDDEIGGTATGVDRQMLQNLVASRERIRSGAQRAVDAARAARRAADEARAAARQARLREQARSGPGGR